MDKVDDSKSDISAMSTFKPHIPSLNQSSHVNKSVLSNMSLKESQDLNVTDIDIDEDDEQATLRKVKSIASKSNMSEMSDTDTSLLSKKPEPKETTIEIVNKGTSKIISPSTGLTLAIKQIVKKDGDNRAIQIITKKDEVVALYKKKCPFMNQDNKSLSRQQKDDVSRADERVKSKEILLAKQTVKEKNKELRTCDTGKRQSSTSSKNNKCGECGAMGHTKNSRICPH